MLSLADGVAITIEVENEGTARGAATCRIEARDANGLPLRAASVTTDQIEGGQKGRFTSSRRLSSVGADDYATPVQAWWADGFKRGAKTSKGVAAGSRARVRGTVW